MPREPRDRPSRRQAAIDGEAPSRTQLKQQMQELQDLGEAVSTLPDDRLARLKIDDRLRDAIAELRRTRSFEGKRRQLQYIGKLMKLEDAGPLREAVADFRLGGARTTLALHQAESWRDRLLAEDDALDAWVRAHPATDVQQLRSLVRSARKEKLEPGARHGRAYRELFQLVKEHLRDAADEAPAGSEAGSDAGDGAGDD
ncbi:MAG TPA: ribosome biogenesis factor YjgA [Burkholderiaceae bacterium]